MFKSDKQVDEMWNNLSNGAGRVLIRRDGALQQAVKGVNEALVYIHSHQGQSIQWACCYEGWTVEREIPVLTPAVDLKQGDQIIYVPSHLNSYISLEDDRCWGLGMIQRGFVYGVTSRGVFCHFWKCQGYFYEAELFTKSTSQLCSPERLLHCWSFASDIVDEALSSYLLDKSIFKLE